MFFIRIIKNQFPNNPIIEFYLILNIIYYFSEDQLSNKDPIPIMMAISIKSIIEPNIPHAITNRIARPKLSGSTQFQASMPEPIQEMRCPKMTKNDIIPPVIASFIFFVFLWF